MASPWKFLVRLVSSRRQQKQTDHAIDVVPDVTATAEQPDTPLEESAGHADQPTRDTPTPVVQSDPVSAGPEPLKQTGGDIQGKAAPGTSRVRAKRTAPVAVVSHTAAVFPTISDEISLDQEIRMLRGQLISKLRLQNAHLKKMLERFEG